MEYRTLPVIHFIYYFQILFRSYLLAIISGDRYRCRSFQLRYLFCLFFILNWMITATDKNIQRITVCLATAFAIATAPVFWSQAVIIEVYALNAVFVCLALVWLYLILNRWSGSIRIRQMIICLLSWICGLGIGNHTTYIFIYPLAILGIFYLFKSDMKRTLIYLSIIGWFSGILTYFILPARASLHPPVNWGDATTLQGLVWLVTGGSYSGNLFSILPNEVLARVMVLIGVFFKQFGLFGSIAGVLGLINFPCAKKLKWAMVYVLLVFSIFSIGYRTNDSILYIIPGLIVFSIWIGWGIYYLWQFRIRWINWGAVIALVFLINTVIVLPERYDEIDPRNGDLSNYAETTLTKSDRNSIVYPESDGETFSLWYYHFALGVRPDVKIISKGLLQYPWYRENLKTIYPDLHLE